MSDLFAQLPRLSFRGILVPMTARSASFDHDDVMHKFTFRDGELVESQGTRNRKFSYTIPFREGIQKAPYRRLFSETFLQFVAACHDRTPGQLVDPVLGVFRAKVTSFHDDIDVTKRDGVDVQVEFTEAPSLDSLAFGAGALVGISPKEDAKRLDDAVQTVDWKQEQPPEPTVNPLSAIDGFGRQLEFAAHRISASYEDTALRLRRLEETIDAVADPKLFGLRQSARKLRHDVLSLGRGDTGPTVKTARIGSPKPVIAVASSLGVTLPALLALNPTLAHSPTVPAGTVVRYLKAA